MPVARATSACGKELRFSDCLEIFKLSGVMSGEDTELEDGRGG